MAGLDEGVKEELAKVATWGKFKETVLKIFEALFAPQYEVRKKPKLSFSVGKNFDEMYSKIDNLVKERRHEKDISDYAYEEILKSLKGYKGKKSPYRLRVVQNAIRFLNSNKGNITYEIFQKGVLDKLKPMFGKKEVYTGKKEHEERTRELNIWEGVNEIVCRHKDDDFINVEDCESIVSWYAISDISENKKNILTEAMEIIKKNAEINDYYLKKSKNSDLGDVEKEINLHFKLERFKDLIEKNKACFWNVDKHKTDYVLKNKIDILEEIKKVNAEDVEKIWKNIIVEFDQSFSVKQNKLKIRAGVEKVADWIEISEEILKSHDMRGVADKLRKSYYEIENAKKLDEVFSNFAYSLRMYFAQDNMEADRIAGYLTTGLALYTGAEGVCKVFFPRLAFAESSFLQQSVQGIIKSCTSEKYDISKINTFVEKIKKEKF